MSVYLDYAAATPVDPIVLEAMLPYFSSNFYNPSAIYSPASEVQRALSDARSTIAQLIGAKSSEIIFTAGGTEANNLAVNGLMQKYQGKTVAFSAIEHDSVRFSAQNYANVIIPVDEKGLVNEKAVSDSIDENTCLVSVMYANNEIGTVQPIRKISLALEQIRKDRIKLGNDLPLYLHVDAAQAGNYLDLHVHRLGIDLMTVNGGKIYGPKQSAFLFVKSGINLEPQVKGGGQERNLRSGTENVANAVGLAKALEISLNKKHDEVSRLQDLQDYFIKKIKEQFPIVSINGSLKYRLPNNIHITIPGIDNERVLMALDMDGIYAAAGSACSASNDEPSHVLAAMGYDDDYIRSSLRFSMGRQTSEEDIDHTIQSLVRILA